MPPTVTDINRVFRDHVRYTGDGQPNAPVNSPLPTGSPMSGVFNATKKEIRDVLIQILQGLGDPAALDLLLTEMRFRKVIHTANANFANTTFGEGVETVIFRNVSNTMIWQRLNAAPVPVVTGKHQQDAQGQWWERVFQALDTTPSYASRAAAVTGAALLPTSVTQIIVVESGQLVMRSRTASADDPLFPSGARWGATLRLDVANAGKLYHSRQAAVDVGQSSNPGTLGRIITFEGTAIVVRGPGATLDDPLFPSNPSWGVIQRFDVAAEAAARAAAIAGVEAKLTILEDAPILADGSRALLRFGDRDIMRMTPTGPRLSGAAAGSVPAPAGGWAATENALGQVEFSAQAARRGIHAVDRFREAGGHRYPTALVDATTRKAIIFSVYGQSNADVTEMNDPLIWPAPPMPDHILMLNDVNGARGGLRGWMGVAAPATSSLVPAREDAVYISSTDSRVQSYATAAAALLNALQGAPYKVFAVRSHAVGGHPLVGSNLTTGIWKNSAGDYLAQWTNWTQDIRNMRNSLIALGYQIEAVHICFTHQEADWQLDRATYVSQFAGMKAEREAILAADLPGVPVRWFVDQASGSGLRSGSYRGGAWPSRLSIVDIGEAHANLTMVMPRYTMPFGFNGGVLEDIHHSHYARILQGEAYGYAMREILEGRPWKCPRMLSGSVAANTITVNFDSLLPIVIDPTFCKVRQDMGFKIGDGTIAVQSVTQTGQRQVAIQCSASPAGQLLAYAWREQDAQDVADQWPIATGAIRDAWEAPSLFLPGQRILRPALGYTLQL